jgi:hypothetical protein
MVYLQIFVLALIFTLSSCSKPAQSPVDFKVTIAGITGHNHPVMFFARNIATNESLSRKIPADADSMNLDLPNGNWKFSLITWDGENPLEGHARCFTQDYVLDGSPVFVAASLMRTNCSNQVFGGSLSYSAAEGFLLTTFNNCNNLAGVTSASSLCNSGTRGFAQSIRLGVLQFDETKGDLKNIALESNCINLNSASSKTNTSLRLPASTGNGIFQFSIKAYSDANCMGSMSRRDVTDVDLGSALKFYSPSQLYTVTQGLAAAPIISFAGQAVYTAYLFVPSNIIPTTFLTNGSPTTCTGALPSGLSYGANCTIIGTPLTPLAPSPFTVTATNSLGSVTTPITIEVRTPVPEMSFPGGSQFVKHVGETISIIPTMIDHGFPVSSCNSTLNLVSYGLTLDPNTCAITGTPTSPFSGTFLITALNAYGSSNPLTVQLTACPTNYIAVPGNAELGTNSFCVAKFEMKNLSNTAVSQPAFAPWVNITAPSAKIKCTSIPAPSGGSYDLISNREWMTIARDIESVGTNWSSGSVGVGVLYRGHSDGYTSFTNFITNTPAIAGLAADNDTNPYSGTGNNTSQTDYNADGGGLDQKRIHILSNGKVIWDFAGNVREWVDWTAGGGFDPAPTVTGPGCDPGFIQFPAALASCSLNPSNYAPANPQNRSNYDTSYGLGSFFNDASTFASRGGMFGNAMNSGIFMLQLGATAGTANTQTGFRCVYRP